MFAACVSRSAKFAAATAIAALVGASPVLAEDVSTNLGPVGPREPILASIGTKRMIAFYEPDGGSCFVSTVVWDEAAPDAPYASARLRVKLEPGQAFDLDGAKLETIKINCGEGAGNLTVGGLLATASTNN
jgi:hypothetical protein